MAPFLSIVTPVFNRERVIARCIESVLSQDWADYEFILVDDCSSDQSAQIMRRFDDERIRIHQHIRNQGVGPTMTTGLSKAQGEWALRLDSDDELVEGCLKTVYERLSYLPRDIMGARFLCKLDDGTISPNPLPKAGLLNYIGFIKFLEEHVNSNNDFVDCIRVTTLDKINYPTNSGLEDLYHLSFHERFHSYVFHDVIRLYHQDADNQLAKRVQAFNLKTDIKFARDRANILECVVAQHGEALRQHGPRLYRQYVLRLAVLEFLIGHRGMGLRFSLEAIEEQPASLRAWCVLVLGTIGPRSLLWAQAAMKFLSAR